MERTRREAATPADKWSHGAKSSEPRPRNGSVSASDPRLPHSPLPLPLKQKQKKKEKKRTHTTPPHSSANQLSNAALRRNSPGRKTKVGKRVPPLPALPFPVSERLALPRKFGPTAWCLTVDFCLVCSMLVFRRGSFVSPAHLLRGGGSRKVVWPQLRASLILDGVKSLYTGTLGRGSSLRHIARGFSSAWMGVPRGGGQKKSSQNCSFFYSWNCNPPTRQIILLYWYLCLGGPLHYVNCLE